MIKTIKEGEVFYLSGRKYYILWGYDDELNIYEDGLDE